MKIGIAGCGAIGAEVAIALTNEPLCGLELVAIYDVLQERARALAVRMPDMKVLPLDALVEHVDLVVEATTVAMMPVITRKALSAGCHVLVMSVGGLANAPDLPELATQMGRHIYLPSGAIAGIDAVLAAREAGLTTVSLVTTKHPKSLAGAPYLTKQGIALDTIQKATTLFEGSAREAIQGFPATSNVAITLSFAGIGMDATQVKIVADPASTCTRHEVHAKGATETITAITECAVSPRNPRTSHLAIMSSLALLRSLGVSLRVGT